MTGVSRLSLFVFLLTTQCATQQIKKDIDLYGLLGEVCKTGSQTKKVKGTAWLKIKSRDKSGQFPASVSVKSPDWLQLEVTNLLGAREGLITLEKNELKIESLHSTQDKPKNWSGIPLEWAIPLFLGQYPCPKYSQNSELKLTLAENGELSVLWKKQKFLYRFKNLYNDPWVESMDWEGDLETTQFFFDRPDEHTGAPKKWEIRSPQGEVKFRWKDREAN